MKNPFKKERSNTVVWIAAGVAGALAASAGIWFYLRGKAAAEREAQRRKHATDYLQAKHLKKKKQRTDISELKSLVNHE
ncbi:MAG: hypothetical protein ACOH2A_06415 [Sphingobacteriaceae bacterium]